MVEDDLVFNFPVIPSSCMPAANRVIKNTMFLYGKIAITSICLIFATRYTLQALGVEDFGIYNLICSTVVMLSFLNESMTAATQRFMSYSEGEGNKSKSIKIFNSSYVVHIAIAFIIALSFICLMPFVFSDYLTIPENRIHAAKIIYFFTIFTTCMNMMTVPYNAVLVAHENMLYYSVLGSLDGILKLLAAIGTIYVPTDKLITYSFFLMCIGLMNFIVARIYCRRYIECKISFRRHVDKKIIKEMFSFAIWQLTYSASSILSIQGMSLILNSFFGTIMNAAQGIARQVCGQMMTLSNTMMSALNPVIVKSAGSKNQENMIRIVMTGSKFSYFLVIVIALPILFEIPYLLDIWLTEVPDYAIMFCRYEVIQQIIASFTVALVTMIAGVGDIRNFQLFSSLTYILRLPLIYLMLKLFDVPEHAYWVATTAVIVLCIGRVYFAHVKCGLPVETYIRKVILPCSLVTIVIILVILPIVLFIKASLLRLFITLIVSTSTFIVSAYYFALQDSERGLLSNSISNLKGRFIKR